MTAGPGLGATAPPVAGTDPSAPAPAPALRPVPTIRPSSPEQLVERARAGDAEAWVTLYRNAYPGLYAFARRRLPTHDDAVDAVSETMARAVADLGRYRSDAGGFPGWLFGILRNVVRNVQRRDGRPVPVVGEAAPPDVLEHLVDDEDAAELRTAFGRLPAADRELLELRVVAGLSAEEVGLATGRTAGAVRMAQSRALGRLRDLMEERR